MKSFKKIIGVITMILLLSGVYAPLKAREGNMYSFCLICGIGASSVLSGVYSACHLPKKNLWWSIPLIIFGGLTMVNAEGMENRMTNII